MSQASASTTVIDEATRAGLTPYAAAALAAAHEAAALRGELEVRPDHLLLGLIERPDSTAAALLQRLAVPMEELRAVLARRLGPPVENPCRETHLCPVMERIVRDAREEAAFMQEPLAGTEHLLLGLAHCPSDAARLLERLAADFAGLRQELATLRRLQAEDSAPARAPGDAPPGSRFGNVPLPVVLVACLGMLQSTCILALSPLLLYLAVTAPAPDLHWRRALILVAWLWSALWGFLLSPRLLKRRRAAWSAAEALLVVKSGSALLALFPAMLWLHGAHGRTDGFDSLYFEVMYLYAVGVLTLAVTFFRASGWFGIRRELAWKTVFRERAWLVLLTAVVEAGAVLSLGVRPW